MKEPESKQPTSASYLTIQNVTKDVLVLSKLQVFVYISKILKPYLVKYQTDEPMIRFLAKDLHDVLDADAQICKIKSVLDSVDTMHKIKNLDVMDKKNHKAAAEIDVGFAAKATLENLVKNKAVGKRGILQFRMEYAKFITHGTSKILGRSPMKYKLVWSLVCLNPLKMNEVPEECTKAFEIVLWKLIEAKWRSSSVADDLLEQYKCFLQVIKKEHDFWVPRIIKKELMSFCMHTSIKRREFQPHLSVLKLADNMPQPVNGRGRIQH